MKLHYHKETDSLYVELKEEPSMETIEIADGVNVDLDVEGAVVGMDIDLTTIRLAARAPERIR